MFGDLDSLELQAAIGFAAMAQRAAGALDAVPSPGALVTSLSSLAGEVSGLAGGLVQPIASTFDHLASYWQRPDGLFVPVTPALIGRASPPAAKPSGLPAGAAAPISAAAATPPRRGGWAEAIDLDGLVLFLRRTHPTKTADHVAALTGESRESVRKWLKREAAPSFRATVVLVCVYGPELLAAALKRQPGWLAETRAGADRLQLARELAAFRTRIDAAIGPGTLAPEGDVGWGLAR